MQKQSASKVSSVSPNFKTNNQGAASSSGMNNNHKGQTKSQVLKLGSLSAGRVNKIQSKTNLNGGRSHTPMDQQDSQIILDSKFVHNFTMQSPTNKSRKKKPAQRDRHIHQSESRQNLIGNGLVNSPSNGGILNQERIQDNLLLDSKVTTAQKADVTNCHID
jgi:hypothetical protein